MAGIYESGQVGQRQEISDEVFNAEADQTPFSSMVKKDPKPAQKLSTYQVEKYRRDGIDGVMDGADVSTYSHQGRVLLTAVAQKLRAPWFVSDFADVTDVAGLPQGEKGKQKAAAAIALKFAIEGRCLSEEECSTDDGGSTPNETRGAFKWIQNGEQATYPVNSSYRPSANSIYSSTLAALNETVFEGLLQSAFKERRGRLSIDQFTGIELKEKMGNWTARDPEASASNYPVRTFNQDAKSRQIIKVVDVLEFSAGTVRIHLSTFLRLAHANSADAAGTHKSAIGLDMSMWALAFNRRPRMVELPDLGGGPRGFSDCIGTLKCFNPMGQYALNIDS